MKKTVILVLAIILSLGVMACSGDSGGVKECIGSCKVTADCDTGSVCDSKGSKQCVQCVVNADCDSSYKGGCNTSTHTCKYCAADSDCAGFGIDSCDKATGYCKQCTKDTDCVDGTTLIGTGKCGDFSCYKCTKDADCLDMNGKVCSNNYCVACVNDGDCATGQKCYHFDSGSMCYDICLTDADCPAEYGYVCDEKTGKCACDKTVCAAAYTGSTLTGSCK